MRAEAEDLLFREARALDTRDWEGWLAFYTDDAVYWAPALTGDDAFVDDPDNDVSLMYLSHADLEARIVRVEEGDSFASDPLPLTTHLVSNVLAEETADGIAVTASWLCRSFWRIRDPAIRSGHYAYVLRQTNAGLRIVRKTVFIHDDRIFGPIDFYNV